MADARPAREPQNRKISSPFWFMVENWIIKPPGPSARQVKPLLTATGGSPAPSAP